MTQPVPADPAQQAVREQLGVQAQAVTGTDVAGVYGDPAGAAQRTPEQTTEEVASGLQAKGAAPSVADLDTLTKQLAAQQEAIAKLQAAAQAATPAPAAPAKPTALTDVLHSVTAPVYHAFQLTEERIQALEKHLGLRKTEDTAE